MTSETAAPPLAPLSAEERVALLQLARTSIACAVAHRPEPVLAAPTHVLAEPGGAFVSLHDGDDLRGCVGTLESDRPLWMTVRRLAVAAAFDDPRFAPVRAAEVDRLTIEISRLTRPLPAHPDDVVPGRHGVCIERSHCRGVFLPQVATEYSWDRIALLEHLCQKAGLPVDAWRDPAARLSIFEADIIS